MVHMTDLTHGGHEYLTVQELAELLRLKERKVYDLAASGEVPCSRATGKLLFPAAEIRQWIERARSAGGTGASTRPQIVLGSHDPLLDWAIRQSRCGLATHFDGSLDGLDRFVRGEGIAAGLHIHDARQSSWNTAAVAQAAGDQNAVLIAFARRRRGLVFRQGEHAPSGISDLAGLRMTPRQPESGTDRLFRNLAASDGVDLSTIIFTDVARTEDDAVENVRRGQANLTFGLEAVARTYGMAFVPLITEEFSLLVDRKAWFEPPFRALMAFCAADAFRQRAAASGGYDVAALGDVLWNA